MNFFRITRNSKKNIRMLKLIK